MKSAKLFLILASMIMISLCSPPADRRINQHYGFGYGFPSTYWRPYRNYYYNDYYNYEYPNLGGYGHDYYEGSAGSGKDYYYYDYPYYY